MQKEKISNNFFGIGSEADEDEFKALSSPSHPRHPASVDDKVERLLDYIEQMQRTNRDNTAIIHQMMQSMEERVNKKIDKLRDDMTAMMEANAEAAEAAQAARQPIPYSSRGPPARRSSALEVKAKTEKYAPPTAAALQQQADNVYETIEITPHPGFVVKTRQLLKEKHKVFINIFHHEHIALNPPGLTAAQATDKPYMMMDEPFTTVDRVGASCVTFNVGISSEYFTQPNPNVDIIITAPSTIYKVCACTVVLLLIPLAHSLTPALTAP
jgi:hypothetical protein